MMRKKFDIPTIMLTAGLIGLSFTQHALGAEPAAPMPIEAEKATSAPAINAGETLTWPGLSPSPGKISRPSLPPRAVSRPMKAGLGRSDPSIIRKLTATAASTA